MEKLRTGLGGIPLGFEMDDEDDDFKAECVEQCINRARASAPSAPPSTSNTLGKPPMDLVDRKGVITSLDVMPR